MGCSNSIQIEAITDLKDSSLNKEKVEIVIKKAIESEVATIDNLCEYFKQNTTNFTEEEKALLAYKWLGLSVKYNEERILRLRESSHKAVISAQASIFNQITTALGIETVFVKGYVKDNKYDPEKPLTKPNHEWNAVKLKSRWQLVDSAWRNEGDSGFCPDPKKFIRTHFPEESQWQLLKQPITKEQFEQQLNFNNYFYKCGLVSVEPDKAVITTKGQNKYLIHYQKDADIKVMGKLSYLADNEEEEISNGLLVQKLEDHFEVDVAFNKKGKYKVEFFAAKTSMKSFKLVFEYIVNCTEDSPEKLLFPTLLVGYEETNAVLLEPKKGLLKKNETVRFKINMENADEAAIIMGEEWTILERTGYMFEGEVKIDNNEVKIFYKKAEMKSFRGVLKFEISD